MDIANETTSFVVKHNIFDGLLLEKAKTEIVCILEKVRKSVFVTDKRQPLSPFQCFSAVCPDQFFPSFRQWRMAGLGDKYLNEDKYRITLANIVEFFLCEIKMMTLELSAVSLERKIVKDDFDTFKRVRDIIARADMPVSNRKDGVGVAQILSFYIDPIVSDFVGTINCLWSSFVFYLGVSWVDLDDAKL